MKEIRWHARAGQGAKTASQLLAVALLEDGKSVQAFPEYGPERRGAPLRAFTRYDDRPIRRHDSVTTPDVGRRPRAVATARAVRDGGLKPGGFVLDAAELGPLRASPRTCSWSARLPARSASRRSPRSRMRRSSCSGGRSTPSRSGRQSPRAVPHRGAAMSHPAESSSATRQSSPRPAAGAPAFGPTSTSRSA